MNWLEIDCSYHRLKTICLAVFYILQILNNIGSGILSPSLIIWGLIKNRGCDDWQNNLNMVNLYLFSITTFLQSIVILLILKEVHAANNYQASNPYDDATSDSDSRNEDWIHSENGDVNQVLPFNSSEV